MAAKMVLAWKNVNIKTLMPVTVPPHHTSVFPPTHLCCVCFPTSFSGDSIYVFFLLFFIHDLLKDLSFVDTCNGLYVKQLSFTPSSTRLFRVRIDFNRGCCFLVQAMLPGVFPFHQFNSSKSSLVFFLLFELSVKQFYSTFWFQNILMKLYLAKNRCLLITFWYICYFALNLSFTPWSIILTYFCT